MSRASSAQCWCSKGLTNCSGPQPVSCGLANKGALRPRFLFLANWGDERAGPCCQLPRAITLPSRSSHKQPGAQPARQSRAEGAEDVHGSRRGGHERQRRSRGSGGLVRNNWITLECNAADCWVGVYWERKRTHYRTGEGIMTAELHVRVCLVPCFPLHFIHTHVD
jgi:hypothetical protein